MEHLAVASIQHHALKAYLLASRGNVGKAIVPLCLCVFLKLLALANTSHATVVSVVAEYGNNGSYVVVPTVILGNILLEL